MHTDTVLGVADFIGLRYAIGGSSIISKALCFQLVRQGPIFAGIARPGHALSVMYYIAFKSLFSEARRWSPTALIDQALSSSRGYRRTLAELNDQSPYCHFRSGCRRIANMATYKDWTPTQIRYRALLQAICPEVQRPGKPEGDKTGGKNNEGKARASPF